MSDANSDANMDVAPLGRSAEEMAELRRFCALWQSAPPGSERFWSFDDIVETLSRPGCFGIRARKKDQLVWDGIAFVAIGIDTADLIYIYVKREARKTGVARALLGGVVDELGKRPDVCALFLEVRTSNVAAQALYESFGMQRIGLRKKYYADGEDALVYSRNLPSKGPS